MEQMELRSERHRDRGASQAGAGSEVRNSAKWDRPAEWSRDGIRRPGPGAGIDEVPMGGSSPRDARGVPD